MDGWDTCVSREDSPGGINSTTPVAGTGSFRNGVVESDGEQMLLFEGRNGDGRIARAVFSLEGDGPYALDIPASPVFLVSVPGGGHRPHRTCQYRGYHLL